MIDLTFAGRRACGWRPAGTVVVSVYLTVSVNRDASRCGKDLCIRSVSPTSRERGLHDSVSESRFWFSHFGMERRTSSKSRNRRPNWLRLRQKQENPVVSMTCWRRESPTNYGSGLFAGVHACAVEREE